MKRLSIALLTLLVSLMVTTPVHALCIGCGCQRAFNSCLNESGPSATSCGGNEDCCKGNRRACHGTGIRIQFSRISPSGNVINNFNFSNENAINTTANFLALDRGQFIQSVNAQCQQDPTSCYIQINDISPDGVTSSLDVNIPNLIYQPVEDDSPDQIDTSTIDPDVLRDTLINLVDRLDQEIVNLNELPR